VHCPCQDRSGLYKGETAKINPKFGATNFSLTQAIGTHSLTKGTSTKVSCIYRDILNAKFPRFQKFRPCWRWATLQIPLGPLQNRSTILSSTYYPISSELTKMDKQQERRHPRGNSIDGHQRPTTPPQPPAPIRRTSSFSHPTLTTVDELPPLSTSEARKHPKTDPHWAPSHTTSFSKGIQYIILTNSICYPCAFASTSSYCSSH